MRLQNYGDVAQLARALDWQSRGRGFESHLLHKAVRRGSLPLRTAFLLTIRNSSLLKSENNVITLNLTKSIETWSVCQTYCLKKAQCFSNNVRGGSPRGSINLFSIFVCTLFYICIKP